MQVVFSKTGKYSIDPVHGPVIECVRHEYTNLPEPHAKMLIRDGWAREYFELKAPWLEKDWESSADDAKVKLDEYVKSKYGTSIDKRKSVRQLITIIKKMRRKND